MKFGLMDILQIIGSLAFFIYGMKIMSDGIQRAAGSQLRNILRSMTKNRYLGVFTGFVTTATVQSSSATTVMTVSFVNAGLLSLVESAGVMMGANIGTTITGWLVSILGFKVKLNTLSIPLIAFGLPMLFTNKGKWRYWGEFIIGFAILFLGLSYLKGAVPDIKGHPDVLSWVSSLTEWGIFSRLMFVFIGALVTIIVQSSSAAMAITLTMCANGWLPFDVAAAMILGENIGTTITAELASIIGNLNAKRSARIHSLFNIIGATWMVIVLPVFLHGLSAILTYLSGGLGFNYTDAFTTADDMPIALSAFHTVFNLANVLVLIGFVPILVRLAIWSVKLKDGEEDDEHIVRYIGSVIRTPELATVELQKETASYGEITSKMSKFFSKLMNSVKVNEQSKMLVNLAIFEERSDKIEAEITEYITKLTDQELTPETSMRLRSFLYVCNDLERIGDIYYQLSKTIEQKIKDKLWFEPTQRELLNNMISLIDKAFSNMNENLNQPKYENVNMDNALEIEARINEIRDQMRDYNLSKIGSSEYNTNAALIFNNVFSSLERIGDHIVKVNESIVGLI
jgi:phosphate:Na+ symporter